MVLKDSQNFLYNDNLVKELILLCDISKNDTIYEIGPGKGIITKELSKYCNKVICIEYDKNLYGLLKKEFNNNKNVEIINDDILKYNQFQKRPIKFISNIPFNITTDILSKLLQEIKADKLYLILQEEAFNRIAGTPFNNECFKSLMYKPNYVFSLLKTLDPSDFRPRPKVNSVFVEIKKKSQGDIDSIYFDDYLDFISYLFSMSGKSFKEKTRKIFSYNQQKIINHELLFGSQSITKWTYEQWLNLFDRYIKYVTVEKKLLVKGSYNKAEESKNKLEKIHRNRYKG